MSPEYALPRVALKPICKDTSQHDNDTNCTWLFSHDTVWRQKQFTCPWQFNPITMLFYLCKLRPIVFQVKQPVIIYPVPVYSVTTQERKLVAKFTLVQYMPWTALIKPVHKVFNWRLCYNVFFCISPCLLAPGLPTLPLDAIPHRYICPFSIFPLCHQRISCARLVEYRCENHTCGSRSWYNDCLLLRNPATRSWGKMGRENEISLLFGSCHYR